jgi:hypothetical protein
MQARKECLFTLLLFFWPAAYLFIYVLPVASISLTPANDFDVLYYRFKAYLLDSLSSGHGIPLWSPGEGAGFSFFANPFAAVFYPLNLPMAAIYRAVGGYSKYDHRLFAVFGACIFCAGLFRWLRSMEFGFRPAFFAAAVLATCLKVTELLRFPNAIHTAAWIPWILYGVTILSERRKMWRGISVTAIAWFMMLTAGYPYYVYYLQFLLAPYVLVLGVGRSRNVIFAHGFQRTYAGHRRFATGVILAFLVPLGICASYFLKMAELMGQTQDRSGKNFDYSTAHQWLWQDTLGSFVYPPAASIEGWYYFGIIPLLMIVLYAASHLHSKPRVTREVAFIATIAIWIGLLTYITMGRHSVLFQFLWNYWPGFSSLRVWPRMNILLIPLLALTLARAYSFLEQAVAGPAPIIQLLWKWWAKILLGAFLVIAMCQCGFGITGYTNEYWSYLASAKLLGHPGLRYTVTSFISAGALWIVLRASTGKMNRKFSITSGGCLLLLLLIALDVGVLGVQQWARRSTADDFVRTRVAIQERNLIGLTAPRIQQFNSTIELTPQFNVAVLENWDYDRYNRFLRSALGPGVNPATADFNAAPDLAKLLGMKDGRRFFFVHSLDHSNPASFLKDSLDAEAAGKTTIKVLEYTGDLLSVEVTTGIPGVLCFIDNWDSNWSADVNGTSTDIRLAFGTFKAVDLRPGQSVVRFRYRPF